MTTHILVGTSPTDAARRDELLELAARLGAEAAFLQLAAPALGDVLDRVAATGERDIVVVGCSGGFDGPGVSWLRRIASNWWRDHGDDAPVVSTAPAYLAAESEWRALVDLARPITYRGPGLTSAAWEDVPEHRHQVFVCRGPRCTALGAEEAAKGLVVAMMQQGLGDDDVLVTQTGCQFPCNHAPVVTVHPDDVWYGGVDAPVAERIVAEHLVGGRPLADVRLPRRRG